jgi:hypothetical protein
MSEKDSIPRFVIARVGKRTTLSKQAEKDQVLIVERIRRNQGLMDRITRRLEVISTQKKDLLVVAHHIGQAIRVPLDRLAKRSRDCLFCWFCENWGTIEPIFTGLCSLQPRADCSRNSCVSPLPVKSEEAFPLGEAIDDVDVFNNFSGSGFEFTLGAEGGFFDIFD